MKLRNLIGGAAAAAAIILSSTPAYAQEYINNSYAILINQDYEEARHAINIELAQKALEVNGFDPCNVYILTDSDVKSDCPGRLKSVSKKTIEKTIENLNAVSRGKSEKSLFLYVTGHGSETGYTAGNDFIPYEEFMGIIDDFKVDSFIGYNDICHGGNLAKIYMPTENSVFFSVGADKEVSCNMFSPDFWNALIEKKDYDGDGQVTFRDAFNYGQEEYQKYIDNGTVEDPDHTIYVGKGDLIPLLTGKVVRQIRPDWLEQLPVNDLQQLIASSNKPILLDVFATWCDHCKTLESRLSSKERDDVYVVKLDAEKEGVTEFLETQGIVVRGYPSIYTFKQGGLVSKFRGLPSEAKLESMLGENLKTQ